MTESPVPADDAVISKRNPGEMASPPQTTFYLRRSHTYDSSSSSAPIMKRGPTPEIREQLRHLGPSNLASRPRQTRYSAVKIKPGSSVSPSRSGGVGSPYTRRRASESTSLLDPDVVKSAGKSASDAVRALQSYGGTVLERPTPLSLDETANKAVNTEEDMLWQTLQPSHSLQKTTSNRPRLLNNDALTTSPPSGEISPSSPYKPRGPARSGSITEQVVDSNGIRKVILHTSESPSTSEDGNGKHKHSSNRGPDSSEGQDSKPTETNDANITTASSSVNENRDADGGSEAQSRSERSKPKKKSKKKKSKPKTDDGTQEESQPLLR